MLRRTSVRPTHFSSHYFGPMIEFPMEYAHRLTNKKVAEETPRRDPKNHWGLHNFEKWQVHPSIWGLERHNYGGQETRGGVTCDVPPIPVYRSQIWCQGHNQVGWLHPRIFIKVPRGKTIGCKWCRAKFINMSTEDDNDEGWEEDMQRINTTPETLKQLTTPFRDLAGVLRKSNFQDGKEPHPEVYKSVFNPERYAWKQRGHGLPPLPPGAVDHHADSHAAEGGHGHAAEGGHH